MARPRLRVDEDKIRALLAKGWGSRRIAREVGISRSLVQRLIAGRRDQSSRSGSAGARRAVAPPKAVRPDSDRRYAQNLLHISRRSATDEEFAAAARTLDELLDARPDDSTWSLANDVARDLHDTIRKREDAARQAEEDRERWEKAGVEDIGNRWDAALRIAARGLSDVDYSDRRKIQAHLDEVKSYITATLARRMKELKTGTITEALVDKLVEEGLERVADVLEQIG